MPSRFGVNPEDDDVDTQRIARVGSADNRTSPRAGRDWLMRPIAFPPPALAPPPPALAFSA